jgi:DNA-binding transcriptional MerR regulator
MPDTPQTGQAFYRIGEVASRLGIKESCVRYYRKVLYPIVKPMKHNGKHFAYSKNDLQIFKLFVALVRRHIGNLFEAKGLLQKLLKECENDPFKAEARHPEFFVMDTSGVREEGLAVVEEARREALELRRALDENIRRMGKLEIKVTALKQEVKRLRQCIRRASEVAQEILESVR